MSNSCCGNDVAEHQLKSICTSDRSEANSFHSQVANQRPRPQKRKSACSRAACHGKAKVLRERKTSNTSTTPAVTPPKRPRKRQVLCTTPLCPMSTCPRCALPNFATLRLEPSYTERLTNLLFADSLLLRTFTRRTTSGARTGISSRGEVMWP